MSLEANLSLPDFGDVAVAGGSLTLMFGSVGAKALASHVGTGGDG